MAYFHLRLILIAIIFGCSFSHSQASADAATSNKPTETQDGQSDTSGRTEDIQLADAEDCGDSGECEGSDDLFLGQLQQNYQTGFAQMVDLFESTNSILTSINTTLKGLGERMHKLEEQMDEMNTTLSNEVKTLKAENIKFRLELSGPMENMETTTNPPTTTTEPSTPEEFLRSLTPVVKGNSFRGLTTGQIASGIARNYALAVVIENFLDAQLTNYRLDLRNGLEYQEAPTNVSPKSTEIFTFQSDYADSFSPRGVWTYRIGKTGFSMHFLFWAFEGRFAAAFVENNSSVQTLSPIYNACWFYTHTGNTDSFKCINGMSWNSNQTFVVQKDSVYAKLNVDFKQISSILKIQVFKFKP